MLLPERQTWIQELLGKLVTKALGQEVAESQPLMMAGLDSLGTMLTVNVLCDKLS